MTTCRYDRDADDYLTPDGHPCRTDDYGDPTRHCTARRTCANHIGADELTCARCVGRTRADIRQVRDIAALMLPVALGVGVDSQAANLAGPAADVEAWTWRKVAARQGRAWHLSLVEDDDDRHPYSVLTRWHMMIAEDYRHQLPTMSVTVSAEYLERQLHRIAQDDGQDFPLLAREIRRCRSHLESVLHDSRRKERGAPCPECLAEEKVIRLEREYGHWCDDPECERLNYDTDEADRWVCPRNRDHQWIHEDYTRWIEERQEAHG
jgi:hypothetical protein